MTQRLLFTLGRLLPKNAVSRLAGGFARSGISRPIIPHFARRYQINLSEAEQPLEAYGSLTEFFCRRLKPGLRPVDSSADVLVSPVDGAIAQFGSLDRGEMVQAKGISYTAEALLGSAEAARRYAGGQFITLYLSPSDYHRIHTPVTGKVVAASYMPGTLWPVNMAAVDAVAGLYAKNERLVTYLETERFGRVAMVKVGALIVGGVKVTYDQTLGTNVRAGRAAHRSYADGPVLQKADEIGWFEFGSTVILLLEPGHYRWEPGLAPHKPVRLGETLLRRVDETRGEA